MKYVLLILPFLLSCTTLPKADTSKSLFPPGTYQHAMMVTTASSRQGYPFHGAVGVKEAGIKIYLLGPMDVTAMKISETFADGEVKIDNYFEPLKPYESYMRRFYPILRSFVLFPKDKDAWGELMVVDRSSDRAIWKMKGPYGIEILMKEYKNGHPSEFEFKHEKFRAVVREVDSKEVVK